ncbi:MAG: hypothetical protein ACRYG4_23550 [Janthinobacterium lividum]
MKFIKLLRAAYVNGLLRMPHEGVIHLEDDHADRLIEGESAIDVTDDFSAKDNKNTPTESLTTTQQPAAPEISAGHEHQETTQAPAIPPVAAVAEQPAPAATPAAATVAATSAAPAAAK